MLELLYCEQCGTVFYGGKRHSYHEAGTHKWLTNILPTSSNLEDLPERQSQVMVEKRNYHEFAVFYPIPTSEDDDFVERKLREHEVKMLHKASFGKNATFSADNGDCTHLLPQMIILEVASSPASDFI